VCAPSTGARRQHLTMSIRIGLGRTTGGKNAAGRPRKRWGLPQRVLCVLGRWGELGRRAPSPPEVRGGRLLPPVAVTTRRDAQKTSANHERGSWTAVKRRNPALVGSHQPSYCEKGGRAGWLAKVQAGGPVGVESLPRPPGPHARKQQQHEALRKWQREARSIAARN